jgi:hypothetical protein
MSLLLLLACRFEESSLFQPVRCASALTRLSITFIRLLLLSIAHYTFELRSGSNLYKKLLVVFSGKLLAGRHFFYIIVILLVPYTAYYPCHGRPRISRVWISFNASLGWLSLCLPIHRGCPKKVSGAFYPQITQMGADCRD